VLISADFAGIELRVAAALSGDENLRRMIIDDVDIHWLIARQVFGPNATKADRYAVKPMVYGKLYGAGIPTLAAQVGCGIDVAKAVVNTLDAITPTLAEWSAKLRARVQAGLVRFPVYSGATLHLPHGRPHAAPKYAIQRTAREILVDAMLRWRDTCWGDCVLLRCTTNSSPWLAPQVQRRVMKLVHRARGAPPNRPSLRTRGGRPLPERAVMARYA
jgi:hypothetical protein